MSRIRGKDRQLHAIVTGTLEGRKEMELVFLKGRGPEEQVEADFHGGASLMAGAGGGDSNFRQDVILLPFL